MIGCSFFADIWRAPQRENVKHFRDGLCVVACERRYVIDMSERHNEKIRSIFEMGSALLHVGALISILQKKQPVWAAFSVKGRVYYYDKPNIGSCLFFSFNIFLPIGEGVPAAFRGRGLQAEVKGGVLSTSFVVYCKNMDKV